MESLHFCNEHGRMTDRSAEGYHSKRIFDVSDFSTAFVH